MNKENKSNSIKNKKRKQKQKLKIKALKEDGKFKYQENSVILTTNIEDSKENEENTPISSLRIEDDDEIEKYANQYPLPSNPIYIEKVGYFQTILLDQDTIHSIQILFNYILDEYISISKIYDPDILKNNGIIDFQILFQNKTIEYTKEWIQIFNQYLDEHRFSTLFIQQLFKLKNLLLIHKYDVIDRIFISLTSNITSMVDSKEIELKPYSSDKRVLTTDNLFQIIRVFNLFINELYSL